MYTHGTKQSGSIPLENGYSSDRSLTLSDKNFRTGLKTSSYADLKRVTAPSIQSNSSCKLTACTINNVYAGSYLEAKKSNLQTLQSSSSTKLSKCTVKNITSGSYVEMDEVTADVVNSSSSCKVKNCPNIAQIHSGSYLEASKSKVGLIVSSSSMKIKNCQVNEARSGSYFEGTESTIEYISASSSAKVESMQGVIKSLKAGSSVEAKDSSINKLEAISTVKAVNSLINDLTAGRLVTLNNTSVNGKINAGSLNAHGGKLVSVNLDGKADLINCSVIEKLFADKINGASCKVLGELNAKSDITIKDGEEIGSIETRKANIINSHVLGNINAINLKLTNTRVGGVVTTADQELVLNNSRISKLVMKKPQVCVELSTVQIHDIFEKRYVPHDIRHLVEYILLDKANIQIAGNQYKVTIGASSFTVNANSRGAGNQFGGMFGSVGNLVIGGGGMVNIGGMSISGNGISISGGSIIGDDGEEYPMDILNNPTRILAAHHMVNQIKADIEVERQRLEQLEPAPQVVIVCGGHIEELCFETPGGVVLYERGGTVGKITRPEGDEMLVVEVEPEIVGENKVQANLAVKAKIPKEPPEEFLSPISLDVMKDPYKTPRGHYFDKKDIIDVMAYNKQIFLCPLTRDNLTMNQLTRDDILRHKIEKWLEDHIAI